VATSLDRTREAASPFGRRPYSGVIVQDRGRYIAAAGEGLNQTLTLVDTMVRG